MTNDKKLENAAFHNGPFGFGTPENAAFVKGAEWMRSVLSVMTDAQIADAVRAVAELPDRNSPEDFPEAMLVTADELTAILRSFDHDGPQSAAARDVLAERRRQVEAEGWTPEHDDAHSDGSLGAAAACYAATQRPDGMCPAYWPWKASWWKPRDRRSDLVRAGALILAEIERLDRKG